MTSNLFSIIVSKCPGLRINFTLADVSDAAKELCKNWIYKIASIRGSWFLITIYLFLTAKDNSTQLFISFYVELVPRFYLETSLLRCYRFSCNVEGFPALIERLILMIRGIGDPVVASYASVYLSYAVQQGYNKLKKIIWCLFLKWDIFFSTPIIVSSVSAERCKEELWRVPINF